MEGKLDIMMENHPCIYLIRCIIHAVHVVRSGLLVFRLGTEDRIEERW
jgi:hypothetical protein